MSPNARSTKRDGWRPPDSTHTAWAPTTGCLLSIRKCAATCTRWRNQSGRNRIWPLSRISTQMRSMPPLYNAATRVSCLVTNPSMRKIRVRDTAHISTAHSSRRVKVTWRIGYNVRDASVWMLASSAVTRIWRPRKASPRIRVEPFTTTQKSARSSNTSFARPNKRVAVSITSPKRLTRADKYSTT